MEGDEGEKCMREREEGERGEWEWDEGGLGRALGGEPSVGLSRRKGKPRPIPVGGGREEWWVRRRWKWHDRVGTFVVVVEGRGHGVGAGLVEHGIDHACYANPYELPKSTRVVIPLCLCVPECLENRVCLKDLFGERVRVHTKLGGGGLSSAPRGGRR